MQRLLLTFTKPFRSFWLDRLVSRGLPPSVVPACKFLLTGQVDTETREVSRLAEERRNAIASMSGSVEVWYSPKPGTFSGEGRPSPGERKQFSMSQVAHTGKNAKWGMALNLLAREVRGSAIELGACAGISARYIGAGSKSLITVEGASDLARLARESVADLSHVTVINSTFDDAIDSISGPLDLAFIDGHHERRATLHYFERLAPKMAPGAMVIFDDITWSSDMYDLWRELSRSDMFAHTINMGTIGIAIMGVGHQRWNVTPIVGTRVIGSPAGWR